MNIIEKREEILNSSLSSGSLMLIIVLAVFGFLKPVIENQNSRSIGDKWTPVSSKQLLGNGAVKEKKSVQARKVSTPENN